MATQITRSLASHEEIIESGLRYFVDVGSSLIVIRDEKLYSEKYDSFDDYCRLRWNFGRSYAYRLIDSAGLVEELKMSPIGDTEMTKIGRKSQNVAQKTYTPVLPENEGQARALAAVSDKSKMRIRVWQTAVAEAPCEEDGKPRITAALIRRVAAKLIPKPPDAERDLAEKRKLEERAQKAAAKKAERDQKAAAKLRARENAKAARMVAKERQPGDEPVEDRHPQIADDGKPMFDVVGHPVPRNLRVVFITALQLRRAMRDLKSIHKLVETVGGTPGGEKIDKTEIRSYFLNAILSIRDGVPHAVCPFCEGRGCKECDDLGWLIEFKWRGLAPAGTQHVAQTSRKS